MKNKRRTIRQSVEAILRDYPDTRDCDKLLTLKFWELVEQIPMDNMYDFKRGFIESETSLESIRRARQLVQEEGSYLPTKESVISRRRKRESSMKRNIVKNREVI